MTKSNFKNTSDLINYQELHVKTGLKIFFLEDDSLPTIQYHVLFPNTGSDMDPKDLAGLAFVTACLSEQGAGDFNSLDLQKELNYLGTALDIRINNQNSSIELSGLSWHGRRLWDLLEMILTKPHFKQKEWLLLQKQCINSRLQFLDKQQAVAREFWKSNTFQNKCIQARGSLKSLKRITLQDIKTFYKNKFQKGNPILMLAGKLDQKLKSHIVSSFESMFSYCDQNKTSFAIPAPTNQLKLLTKKDLIQAQIYTGYAISPILKHEVKKWITFKIIMEILGGHSMTSRLFLNLREKQGLTYGVYSYMSFSNLYAYFMIQGATKNSSVKLFLTSLLSLLKKFRDKGIDKIELQRAKACLKSQYLKTIETVESQLYYYVYYTCYFNFPTSMPAKYLDILNSISLQDVNQLIKTSIRPEHLQSIVYAHPCTKDSLKQLKNFPKLQVISFENHFKENLKKS